MNSTYVVRPDEGMVFKRTESQDGQAPQVSYATAINLAAESLAQADSLVASQWEQVAIEEYRAWQQAQQALLQEQMPEDPQQEYSAGNELEAGLQAEPEVEPGFEQEPETEPGLQSQAEPEPKPAEAAN